MTFELVRQGGCNADFSAVQTLHMNGHSSYIAT